jgi:putative transposase
MTDATSERPASPFESADWLDPLEEQVRQGIRSLIERLVETELDAALGRQRYARDGQVVGHRNGRRDRQLLGTFGPTTVSL